jgi:CheY-like chemotaxis protein
MRNEKQRNSEDAQQEGVETSGGRQETEPAFESGGGEKVLIVEDEPLVRMCVTRTLTEQGYRVAEAKNGEEALQYLHDSRDVGLVITDLVMPLMDGWALAERIREMNTRPRILFISGHSRSGSPESACGNTLLRKPFTPEDLLAKVREILDH